MLGRAGYWRQGQLVWSRAHPEGREWDRLPPRKAAHCQQAVQAAQDARRTASQAMDLVFSYLDEVRSPCACSHQIS